MYSNMGPKTTPSLISRGGYQIPPPPRRGGNRHPLGNRVKSQAKHKNPPPTHQCSVQPASWSWSKNARLGLPILCIGLGHDKIHKIGQVLVSNKINGLAELKCSARLFVKIQDLACQDQVLVLVFIEFSSLSIGLERNQCFRRPLVYSCKNFEIL